MNVVPAHVYMVLVLIMLTATLVLVMMATLGPIVKQVCIVNVILIEIRLFLRIFKHILSICFQSLSCDMN